MSRGGEQLYKPWEQDVIDLRDEGVSWYQTAKQIRQRYGSMMRDLDEMQLVRRCRSVLYKRARREGNNSAGAPRAPVDSSRVSKKYNKDGTVESICLIELWDGEDLTPEKILAFHKMDPEAWTVISYSNNIWNAMAGKDQGNGRKQMYQSKLVARPKADGISLAKIDEHFKAMDREYTPPVISAPRPSGGRMAEVNIADLHLGRLSWHGDTGYNYDYKIAREMFAQIISETYHELKAVPLEYITFVWANDFFNSDTVLKTTTNGTPQDTDIRWQKLFNAGVEMLVDAITVLAELAPVKTFYTASNHDEITAYHAIKYLEAWFRHDPRMEVNTDARPRKYQLYGNVLLGYTHGDKERPARLAAMMPNEARTLWGDSVTREMHAAHLHSEHAIEEVNGVIVRRISSPTAPDTWSDKAGFVAAVRKAQTFIYDRERGLMKTLNIPVMAAHADNKNLMGE
jgi:hypothetical protein